MPKVKGQRGVDRGNLSRTKEYRAWSGMINRCYSTSYALYHRYGGRGIFVCKRWLGDKGFFNFLKDVGHAPSPSHSIDRIDNDRGYSPKNCKWSTIREQSYNRRLNVKFTFNGKSLPLKQWCEELGVKYSTVWMRINRCGWDFEKSVTTPVVGNGRFKKGHKPYSHEPNSSTVNRPS